MNPKITKLTDIRVLTILNRNAKKASAVIYYHSPLPCKKLIKNIPNPLNSIAIHNWRGMLSKNAVKIEKQPPAASIASARIEGIEVTKLTTSSNNSTIKSNTKTKEELVKVFNEKLLKVIIELEKNTTKANFQN